MANYYPTSFAHVNEREWKKFKLFKQKHGSSQAGKKHRMRCIQATLTTTTFTTFIFTTTSLTTTTLTTITTLTTTT